MFVDACFSMASGISSFSVSHSLATSELLSVDSHCISVYTVYKPLVLICLIFSKTFIFVLFRSV